MERDAELPIANLKVDGGASRNNLLMQFQSDILNTDVMRPRASPKPPRLVRPILPDSPWDIGGDLDEVRSQWQVEKVFSPSGDLAKVASEIEGWHNAVNRVLTEYPIK